RQQVRGGVAQDLDALGIALRDDGEVGVGFDAMREVDQLAVHPRRERGAREPGADRLRDLGGGYGVRKRLRRAVGKTDVGHSRYSLHTITMHLPLTLAIHPYDHVRGLAPQGIDLAVLELPIEEIFFRFTKFQEWHASEMSFGKTVSLMAQDSPAIMPIPVFPS